MGTAKPECRDHREEVWETLSRDLGGQFVNEPGWRQDKVHVQHHDWNVTLDFAGHRGYRSECVHTRFYAPLAEGDFRLRVFPQELIHTVAALAGMPDIRVGDVDFDRAFVIQATDEAQAKKLFADPKLRERMRAEPSLEISLRRADAWGRTDTPAGRHELVLEVPDTVVDAERLRRLYDLFATLLQARHELQAGCAG